MVRGVSTSFHHLVAAAVLEVVAGCYRWMCCAGHHPLGEDRDGCCPGLLATVDLVEAVSALAHSKLLMYDGFRRPSAGVPSEAEDETVEFAHSQGPAAAARQLRYRSWPRRLGCSWSLLFQEPDGWSRLPKCSVSSCCC